MVDTKRISWQESDGLNPVVRPNSLFKSLPSRQTPLFPARLLGDAVPSLWHKSADVANSPGTPWTPPDMPCKLPAAPPQSPSGPRPQRFQLLGKTKQMRSCVSHRPPVLQQTLRGLFGCEEGGAAWRKLRFVCGQRPPTSPR